jgi:hypothetical protein
MYFDVPSDEESVELQRLRVSSSAEEIASAVCGIEPGHALRPLLVETIQRTMG